MSAGVCQEQKAEDSFRSRGARVAGSCELPRVLGPNSGRQGEQYALSIAELYFQLSRIRSCWSIWETDAKQLWKPWGPRGNVLGLFLWWNSLPGKIMSPTQGRWKMAIVLQGSFFATVFGWVLLRQGFTL